MYPLRATSQIPLLDIAEGHSHEHDELCLISAGRPIVRHAGSESRGEAGTLFLFTQGQAHGVWDVGTTVARCGLLQFRINSQVRAEFYDLFERSPERRMLKLSADQQQRFCNTCKKIAFEKMALRKGGFAPAHATTAASVLLALQLIDAARWFSTHSEMDLVEGREKAARERFELRRQIYRHASLLATSQGPMLFNLNPRHDSVRHRFRKLFGISPRGMLVRLQVDRAKGLFRSPAISRSKKSPSSSGMPGSRILRVHLESTLEHEPEPMGDSAPAIRCRREDRMRCFPKLRHEFPKRLGDLICSARSARVSISNPPIP